MWEIDEVKEKNNQNFERRFLNRKLPKGKTKIDSNETNLRKQKN